MGGGGSKKDEEKVVKVDGVNEYDKSMSIVNIHSNTVMYMSTIFVMIIAIVICVYIYMKHGSFCCSFEPPDHHPPAARSRRYVSSPRPGSVIELVRMESGDTDIMKTFAVEPGNKITRHPATLTTLLQQMKDME